MSDKKMKKIDATPFGSSMPDVGMDSFSENVIQNDTTGEDYANSLNSSMAAP